MIIDDRQTILVLGINGMLGHKVFEVLSNDNNLNVFGTLRNKNILLKFVAAKFQNNLLEVDAVGNIDKLSNIINKIKPAVVINCIGIIKQSSSCQDYLTTIEVNALFPHKLAKLCSSFSSKLITIATDCVFDGQKIGAYTENDLPTCHDLYGMSKYLGEVNYDNHLTLRTSIIGHELFSHVSLLDWFLNEDADSVLGYTNAIFSGFTTLEFATVLKDKILPIKNLHGLYHFSVNPISKYDLLTTIGKIYKKEIKIIPDSKVKINRALESEKIRRIIKYSPPNWEDLINNMYQDYLSSKYYNH